MTNSSMLALRIRLNAIMLGCLRESALKRTNKAGMMPYPTVWAISLIERLLTVRSCAAFCNLRSSQQATQLLAGLLLK